MEKRKISDLHRHPLNSRIYSDKPDAGLIESIRENGVMVPVVITPDNQVISGHRRVAACKVVGVVDVPVTIRSFENDEDATEAVVHYNRQRAKTNEQRAREAAALLDVERIRAEKRMKAGENQYSSPPEKLPEGKGDARDKVGEAVGWSGKTAEKAVEAIKYIDKLKEEGKESEAEKLKDDLNVSVSKASRSVPREPKEEKKKAKPTFNRTNDNIKWAKWTWNPVTGCKHDCAYCYAREISMRYTKTFEPCFHEDRLSQPENTKPNMDIPGGAAVFVCSMADLFGSWVPNDWIWPIMKKVEQNPQWTFLFLTKNPARYKSIQFPDNAWAGATVDTQARVKPTQEALAATDARVRFVSCEPLVEPVQFGDMSMIDWLIIGGQSATSKVKAFQPDFLWVESLHMQARERGIPVYWKDNLTCKPEEYPS